MTYQATSGLSVSVKISHLISINTIFSSKSGIRDCEVNSNRKGLPLIRNFHMTFLRPIRFWSGNGYKFCGKSLENYG